MKNFGDYDFFLGRNIFTKSISFSKFVISTLHNLNIWVGFPAQNVWALVQIPNLRILA
jgi:hypothetical protein